MADRDVNSVILIGLDGQPYAVGASAGGTSAVDSDPFTAASGSGTPAMGLYEATPSTLADGDAGVVAVTSKRVLKAALHAADGTAIMTLPVSLASVPSHAVTNAGTFAIQAAGDVDHDAVDSGAPVKVGGKASTSPTAVASGDRSDLWMNLLGAPMIGMDGPGNAGSDTVANVSHPSLRSASSAGGTSNAMQSAMMMYDGSTNWVRTRGDAANGLDVDVTRLPTLANVTTVGTVTTLTGTTTLTPGTGATNLGKAEDAAHTTGDVGVMALGVRAASPTERSAGPTDGDYEPFATNGVGAVWTTQTPTTVGGLTTYHLVSAGTTNATVVKNAAGQLFGYYIYNANAAARKVAFHNASSTPTAGSSVFFSLVIPPTAGANVEFTNGIAFSTGISITTVTELADSGTTGVASGDLLINLFYK